MRTVSPTMAAVLAQPTGSTLLPVVEITSPDGAAVRRLAGIDLTVTPNTYTGELLKLSDVDYRLGRTSDVKITVADTADNRAAVVLGATVKVQLVPAGGQEADLSTVFAGEVSDPRDRSQGRIVFDVVALSSRRYNSLIGSALDSDTFGGAVKADQGRTLPVGLGQHRQLAAVPVDAGSVTRLARSISATEDQALEVTDADEFPASGTVQICLEQIAYTGKSGNTLTGLTRGNGMTSPDQHHEDSIVAEIQTEFVYVVLDHRSGTVDTVYVDGVRQVGEAVTLGAALAIGEEAAANVGSTANLPAKGSIKIGAEWIGYAGIIDGSQVGPLQRGINSTAPAAHSNGAGGEVFEFQVLTDYVFSELQSDGGFDTGFGWTEGTGWNISGGVATKTAGTASDLEQLVKLTPGRQYTIDYTATVTAGALTCAIGGEAGSSITAGARVIETITAGSDGTLKFQADAAFAGTVDDVKLGRPRCTLKFFTPPTIEQLTSIEVNDTIDVSDPGHSHAGSTGTTTVTILSVDTWQSAAAGNPTHTGISNGGNVADGDLGTFVTLDTGINGNTAFTTINHSVNGGTGGRTPSSMRIQAKMNASYSSSPGLSGRLFVAGSTLTLIGEVKDFLAAPANVIEKTLSVNNWSAVTQLYVEWDPINTSPRQEYLFEVTILDVTYQETGSAPAVTSVAKEGTVTLTGPTTGEFIIGREVRVDVAGFLDDVNGTWTGTPNALVERPDQAVRALLREFAGVPAGELDAARFDAFTGERLRLPITAPVRVRTVLQQVEKQFRAVVFHDGDGWVMNQRPDNRDAVIAAPDFDLQGADTVRNEDGTSTLALGVVGLAQLTTRIEWRASPRHDGGWEYAGVEERAIAMYGERASALELTLIDDAAFASQVAEWTLGRLAEPDRPVASLAVPFKHYVAQLGDLVRVRSTVLADVDVAGDIVHQRIRLNARAAGSMTITVESARMGAPFELTVAEPFAQVFGYRQGVGGGLSPGTWRSVPVFQFSGNPNPGTGEVLISFGLAGFDQVPGVNSIKIEFLEPGAPAAVVLPWNAGLTRYNLVDETTAAYIEGQDGNTITCEFTAL